MQQSTPICIHPKETPRPTNAVGRGFGHRKHDFLRGRRITSADVTADYFASPQPSHAHTSHVQGPPAPQGHWHAGQPDEVVLDEPGAAKVNANVETSAAAMSSAPIENRFMIRLQTENG